MVDASRRMTRTRPALRRLARCRPALRSAACFLPLVWVNSTTIGCRVANPRIAAILQAEGLAGSSRGSERGFASDTPGTSPTRPCTLKACDCGASRNAVHGPSLLRRGASIPYRGRLCDEHTTSQRVSRVRLCCFRGGLVSIPGRQAHGPFLYRTAARSDDLRGHSNRSILAGAGRYPDQKDHSRTG